MRLISIDQKTPSLNKLVRMHWAERRKVQNHWKSLLLRYRFKAKGKVRAKFTLYRKRLMDDDNARGGLKPIIDAMKKLGMIVDDSPKWFEHEVKQIKSDKNQTVIEIKEMEVKDG